MDEIGNQPATVELKRGADRRGLAAQLEEFDPLLTKLDALIERERAIVDRINGGRPRPTGSIEKDPTPAQSITASMRQKFERLVRVVDALEREIGNVEQCL